MSWITAKRASAILYRYLKQLPSDITFLVPANVCPIVLATFNKARIRYILLDVSEDSLCIDRGLVEEQLSRIKVAGLLYVRTFGNLEDVSSWFEYLKLQFINLRIVDDRCLCIPTLDDNEFYESVDMTLFSTGYAKFVELNYGGFAYLNVEVSDLKLLDEWTYEESDHNCLVENFNHCLKTGESFRYTDTNWLDLGDLDNEQEYFAKLENYKQKSQYQKQAINNVYMNSIPKQLWLGEKFNNWRFSILVNEKELLLEQIFSAGYFASSHYSCLAGIFSNDQAIVTKKIHSRIVNLFNDHRISQKEAAAISSIVTEHHKKYG